MFKSRKMPKSFGAPSRDEIVAFVAENRARMGLTSMPLDEQKRLLSDLAPLHGDDWIDAVEARFHDWERTSK